MGPLTPYEKRLTDAESFVERQIDRAQAARDANSQAFVSVIVALLADLGYVRSLPRGRMPTRDEWIASLGLEASHAVIRELCTRLERSVWTGFEMTRVAAGEASLARRRVAISSAHNAKRAVRDAKAEAFKLWQDWQTGGARYQSGAAFARHIVGTFNAIESTKTVERWATQWRKDAKPTK